MYDGQSYKNIFSFTHLFDVEPIIIGVHETNTQDVNSVEAVYDISEPINQKCLCYFDVASTINCCLNVERD